VLLMRELMWHFFAAACMRWAAAASTSSSEMIWDHGFHIAESLPREPHQEANAIAPFSLQAGLGVLEPVV